MSLKCLACSEFCDAKVEYHALLVLISSVLSFCNSTYMLLYIDNIGVNVGSQMQTWHNMYSPRTSPLVTVMRIVQYFPSDKFCY